jgi:hypothetical protein
MNIPGMETETRLNNKDVLNPDLSDYELPEAAKKLKAILASLESEMK